MSKRKRVIQVPMDEELLAKLDELSSTAGESRSQLIREACTTYVTSLEKAELDRQYIEGYRRIPESPDMGEAGEILAAENWEEDDW